MGIRKGIISDALYQKLVFLVLIVMIIGVPSSRILMSISQMAFGVLWLAHGNYKKKWHLFIKNRAALVLVSFFLLHVLGVFYSTDLDYAVKDLRTKVPMLIIPFMFVGFPKLDRSQFEKLLYFFIGAVMFVSFYVTIAHFITHEEIRIIIGRDFISHIRFSLSLNLAIFYLIFLRVTNTYRNGLDIFSFVIFFWLMFFLFFLEAFTGIIVFIVLIFSILFYLIYKSHNLLKRVIYIGLIVVGIIGINLYLYQFAKEYTTMEQVDPSGLEKYTASGGKYRHELDAETENGKYIYIYICDQEVEAAWKKRSIMPYDGLDYNGQILKFTLFRYMTSKDLRKDKEGVEALTIQDIKNIENGIANYHYTQGIGVESRLMKIIFEYNNYVKTGDPSGHSVMQRVEYWKTASYIIKKNFWFGVGTGDMNIAFQSQYDEMDSKLDKHSRLRTHNQYLSIWVGLGFLGFLWFLFVLFYPPLHLKSFNSIYYFIFFIAFIVSMLTEDTIETQAGLTFYVFFNSLFLFLTNSGQKNIPENISPNK
jgi:O-antigen ligase